mmetsp:Transcript_39991/g.120507  ORF Transcript_39991/g.120507 Transcript_39991/m.120507 type:complete len:97 (-) Transcript_39991:507-797(-)
MQRSADEYQQTAPADADLDGPDAEYAYVAAAPAAAMQKIADAANAEEGDPEEEEEAAEAAEVEEGRHRTFKPNRVGRECPREGLNSRRTEELTPGR